MMSMRKELKLKTRDGAYLLLKHFASCSTSCHFPANSSSMSFRKVNISPEDLQSISNVSVDSLARWCGLTEDSETNSRSDDDKLFILCRQVGRP